MLMNAVYTMSYMDALTIKPTLLDNIVWDTDEHTQKLKDMLYSKFYNWEISGETLQEFQLFLEAKFNQYKDYYAELLSAYETQIDFLEGNKVTRSATITDDGENVSTPRAEITSENYDLPRTTASQERPSSKTISKGTNGTDKLEIDNERTIEDTTMGGNVIDLKRKYMDLLRSIYAEFADKFKPCFIDLFT